MRAQRPRRDNDDVLALLVQVLMQNRSMEAARGENVADRALRQDMFEEQRRSAQASERQSQQQIDDLLETSATERETFADMLRGQKLEGFLGRGAAGFEREQVREQRHLGLRQTVAQRDFEKELERGRLAVNPAIRRMDVALSRVQDAEDPTTKQIAELTGALDAASKNILSAITAGGRLSKDGVSQGEMRGALGHYVMLLDSLDVMAATADPDVQGKLAPLRKSAATQHEQLSTMLDALGEPPEIAFGREGLRREEHFLGLESELQRIRDRGRLMGEEGTGVADIVKFMQAEEAKVRGGQPRVIPITNPDGTTSSERTISVEVDGLNGGKITVIPTIVEGRQLSNQEAIRAAVQSGLRYPSFDSHKEADAFAARRSQQGGATAAGFLGTPRATQPFAPDYRMPGEEFAQVIEALDRPAAPVGPAGLTGELERLMGQRGELMGGLREKATEARETKRLGGLIDVQGRKLSEEQALIERMRAEGRSEQEIRQALQDLRHPRPSFHQARPF
jgi:hypothetical protein